MWGDDLFSSHSVLIRDKVRWKGGGGPREKFLLNPKKYPKLNLSIFRCFKHELQLFKVVSSLLVVKINIKMEQNYKKKNWGQMLGGA